MSEELNVLLSTELLKLTVVQRRIIAALILLVLPCIRVAFIHRLSADHVKYIFLAATNQIFLVEFLLRPTAVSATISLDYVLTACIVVPAVILAVTFLNYAIFHKILLKEYGQILCKVSPYSLAWEFSIPVNVVQQVGTNVVMTLICQRLGFSKLSVSRTALFGFILIWLERVCIQWVYKDCRPTKQPYLVSITHSGPSADWEHWHLQLENNQYEIFKQDGSIIARLISSASCNSEPLSLLKHFYIPFYQYGIVGVSDRSDLGIWKEFVRECMEHAGGYYLWNRSCQEYVIFSMYALCYPPLFNMSDMKGLAPILLVMLSVFLTSLSRWLRELYEGVMEDMMV